MEHLDLHHTDRLSSLLNHTPDLGKEVDWRWLCLCEDVDMIGGHSFLGNENLLRSVDDEVSSLSEQNIRSTKRTT